MPIPLVLRISGRFLVPLIYFILCTNLAQFLLSGSLTLVARNEISVQVSSLARLVANNILVTRRWKSTSCLALSFLQSSLTLKRISGEALYLVTPPFWFDLSKLLSFHQYSTTWWSSLEQLWNSPISYPGIFGPFCGLIALYHINLQKWSSITQAVLQWNCHLPWDPCGSTYNHKHEIV